MKKIIVIVIVIAIVFALVGCSVSGFNKQIIDLQYEYKYAIIQRYDGEQLLEITSWRDYDNSEQLQLIDTDGRVWLVNSYNTILLSEKED